MNIVLIGFRCTGKTSVGSALARKLEREFIDADDFLQARAGKTIAQIFEQGGEELFRRLEREVIQDLSARDNLVLAVGGGAVLNGKNVRDLKRNGVLILLECDPQTIYERMTADHNTANQRPPLTDEKDLRAEIDALLEKRQPYYRKAADLVINTRSLTVEQIAEEIIRGSAHAF